MIKRTFTEPNFTFLNPFEKDLIVMDDFPTFPKFSGRLWRVKFRITKICNLSCRHCHYVCQPNYIENSLSDSWWLDLSRNFVDFFQWASSKHDIDYPKGYVTGGEPLLRKNLSFKILEILRKSLWKTYLATNASLLNEEDLQYLKSINLRALRFSVDGLRKEHDWLRNSPGNYDKVFYLSNIATKKRMNLMILITVHDGNVKELESLCREFKSIDKNNIVFFFNPVRSAKGTRKHDLKLSPKNYVKYYIPAVIKYGTRPINWKSHSFLHPDYHSKYVYAEKRCRVKTFSNRKLGCAAPSTIDIHSDGTTRACIIPEKTGDFKKQGIPEIIRNNFALVKNFKIDPFCESCNYMKNKICGGGCLGAIWSGKRTIRVWADDTCPLVYEHFSIK